MNRRPRALLYGDVDLNMIDGSAIWVEAMAQALSLAECDTRLLLKAPVHTTRLLDAIVGLPGVHVVRPFEERRLPNLSNALSPYQACQILTVLDEEGPADLLIVRGRRAASRVAVDGHFRGRMWTYLTDVAQSASQMTDDAITELNAIAEASRFLLCQTEELRGLLETWIPDACGHCVLYPPSVPVADFAVQPKTHPSSPARLVYAGKFAPNWNTMEMTELPTALNARGIAAVLHTVGDKIHVDPARPDFSERMSAALSSAYGVHHHGGQPRQEAMRIAAGCDIGLGWRAPELDASLELSTKVLEFGALGLPVVLNRTPAHEQLLGSDYPMFVDPPSGLDEVTAVVARAVESPTVYRAAAQRCFASADRYTLPRSAARLRSYLDRALPNAPSLGGRSRPLRLLVAGHDLKFFTRLLDHLSALPEVELRVDEWRALAVHDASRSSELAAWADVVIVEWCGPAAVWYGRHKRPGSRLVVRLHRFELDGEWPAQLDIAAVDRVVSVSVPYARLIAERTGWPQDKIVTVPNWVDVDQLDRPKTPAARFRLGMIGIAPARKRLDLAIDVVTRLHDRDPRWQLSIKSKMPWEYWWIWDKPAERAHYDSVFRRIQTDPLVDGAVVFDRFGPDVGSWLRRVGYILSTSDDESFHLAPAEGMASGAVPALLPWPGASTIYDPRWIHSSPAALADALGALAVDGWEDAAAAAQQEARRKFALDAVCAQWVTLIADL